MSLLINSSNWRLTRQRSKSWVDAGWNLRQEPLADLVATFYHVNAMPRGLGICNQYSPSWFLSIFDCFCINHLIFTYY